MIVRYAMFAGLLGLAQAAVPGPALAEAVQPALNASARAVRNLREAVPSPDARWVAAVFTDTTADGGRPHIWLLSSDGKSARQVTFSATEAESGERAPQWSADGAALYFLAKRGKTTGLFRLNLAGGEAESLKIARRDAGAAISGWGYAIEADKAAEVDVRSFALSPDSRQIAVIAADGDSSARAAQIKKKDDGTEVGVDDRHPARLYLIDGASGTARVVALPEDVAGAQWDRDGANLQVITTVPDSGDLAPAARAWLVTAAGATRDITGFPPTIHDAALAASGMVYRAQCAIDAPPGCDDLYVRDAATGVSRNLTRDLNGSLERTAVLSADGRRMILTAQVGLDVRLGQIDLASGQLSWISAPAPVVHTIATNRAETGWAMIAGGPTMPDAVWFTARPGAPAVKLGGPALVPADWPTLSSQRVAWKNGEFSLEGIYYAPTLAPGAKAPLIVVVHGGPTGAFADDYSNLAHLLVAQGWAVFMPNPRGSTGHGAAFSAANKNDLGGGDYTDIMTGVDALLATRPIDPARMALIGYSYGGEMAGFVAGRTDRFKALVAGAPVIDQVSEYGTEDAAWYDRWFYGLPWEHPTDVWRQSPIARVGQARTPMLLLQGEDDPTDPIGQSQEMRRALKQMGVPVTLVTYPRETHATLGAAYAAVATREPWHGDDLRRRMITFIANAFNDKVRP